MAEMEVDNECIVSLSPDTRQSSIEQYNTEGKNTPKNLLAIVRNRPYCANDYLTI
jgi:hypothetical protein